MEKAKKFLEDLACALVTSPEKVVVEAKTDDLGVLLTLHVGPEDMGRIVGKEGVTANSIRNLLRVVGAKENARVNLKIAEPTL